MTADLPGYHFPLLLRGWNKKLVKIETGQTCCQYIKHMKKKKHNDKQRRNLEWKCISRTSQR